MSEYQYYDFRAIDHALTKTEMAALRAISTRAVIGEDTAAETFCFWLHSEPPVQRFRSGRNLHNFIPGVARVAPVTPCNKLQGHGVSLIRAVSFLLE